MAEGQEEISAEVAGQKFHYRGMHLGNLLQLIIVAAIALGVYIIHETKVEARASALVMQAEHNKIGDALSKQAEAQAEMNYILTLSPSDRERLNLRMPESLRTKLGAFR